MIRPNCSRMAIVGNRKSREISVMTRSTDERAGQDTTSRLTTTSMGGSAMRSNCSPLRLLRSFAGRFCCSDCGLREAQRIVSVLIGDGGGIKRSAVLFEMIGRVCGSLQS
jgi:hypothetical protein